MKNAIYLDSDFIHENQDSVNALLRRLETLINSTDGISLESSRGHLIYRIMIPKCDLDGAVDIVIPIDNALNTSIKKMMD